MSVKSRNILMILGGGYLIYIGARLMMQTRQSHPQNETMFVAFGAGFAVFGVLVALFYLWDIWKDVRGQKKKEDSDFYVETLEFEDEPEPVIERKNHVQMVKVEKEQKEQETTSEIHIEKEQESADEQMNVTNVEEQEEKSVEEVTTEVKIDIRDAEPEEEENIEATETLEELELSPDEAEEVFPTEEIKLERI